MENKFKLHAEDVLNKQFNVDFKGYSSSEVDEFLDMVISDYQEYDDCIRILGERLQDYERQVGALRAKVVELEGKQTGSVDSLSQPGNVDILKRLSRLESEVFRK